MVTDQQAEQSRAAERDAQAARTASSPAPAQGQREPVTESAERVRQTRELSERGRERGLER